MSRRAAFRGVALLAIALAGVARGDPVEPPADVADGEDVAYEAGDSLAQGEVELGLGLEGTTASHTRRRRRVRFEEPDLAGTVREGSGDPLSGGAVAGRGQGRPFVIGKLSPRWGRGLLLGAAGEPWQRAFTERDAARRGRSGEGLLVASGPTRGIELMGGRFARRDLAGARVRRGVAAVGLLAGRGRVAQTSLTLAPGPGEIEAVLDRGGSWRAEGLLERPLGASWHAALCARGGSAGFRSLAEPARGGPARALTLATAGPGPGGETRLLASVWRFRAGLAGARAAIEWRRELAAGRLIAGFEEQHGARKDRLGSGAFRQGGWMEWSGGDPALALALRHESWCAAGGLRDLVRTVTSARIEAAAPRNGRVTLTHAAFRVLRGESLYLAEAESDRLVLRALAGEGHRTRLELAIPAGRGSVRATVLITEIVGRRTDPRWTLEWVRRSRPARAAPS